MRLRRSQLDRAGIVRVRRGRGFAYLGPDGMRVEASELERIRALVIPPAWSDVWICPYPNGHIQAVGIDSAGRRQYRYHDAWTKRRDGEKFARMIEFAGCLPELRSKIAADLRQPGLTKSRVLALGVRLLDVGMFRVGGEEYAAEHETYGLATLEKRHLRICGGDAYFDYAAKGGIRRKIVISDPDIVDLLSQLKRRRGGGSCLLAWREDRRWVDVSSQDLNAYIKEQSCGGFTAKDFRTWEATLLAAVLCAQAPEASSASAQQRRVAGIVREVAESLGNTPAVCRKSYIDPRVLDNFYSGETIAATVKGLPQPVDLGDRQLLQIERAVISLLAPPSDFTLTAGEKRTSSSGASVFHRGAAVGEAA
jgi:DNA topoisomerase I